MIFNEGGFGLYMTLWPIYIASLGASPTQIGLVIGLTGFARMLFLLPSGLLSDRLTHRTLIAGGRAMAVAGLLLIAASRRWWQLIPATTVMAAGTLAFPAISNAIAENAGQGWNRTRAFTLIYTVGPSAAYLITPTLGGFIAAQLSLRILFLCSALLTAGAVTAFATITPRPVVAHDGPPATYRSTLGERTILTVFALQLATIFVLTLGATLVPNFLQDVHGLGIERIGWLGSSAAIGSAILGVVIDRVAVFRRPLSAVALSTAAVAGMLVLMLVGRAFWLFALAYLLRGGYMVAWAAFYGALGEVTPDRLRGRVYALAELVAGAAVTGAPFVAGWLYSLRPTAPLMAGLLLIVPLLIAIAWARHALQSAPAPALAEKRA